MKPARIHNFNCPGKTCQNGPALEAESICGTIEPGRRNAIKTRPNPAQASVRSQFPAFFGRFTSVRERPTDVKRIPPSIESERFSGSERFGIDPEASVPAKEIAMPLLL